MRVVQVRLKSGDSRLTAWVEDKVKIGSVITLKDSDNPMRKWEILSIDSEPVEQSSINRGWHNNI